MLIQVDTGQIGAFVDKARKIKTADDYKELMDVYGFRRTNPVVWDYSDKINIFINKYNDINVVASDYN